MFCSQQQEGGGVVVTSAGSPSTAEGSPGVTPPACEKRKAEDETSNDLKKVSHIVQTLPHWGKHPILVI